MRSRRWWLGLALAAALSAAASAPARAGEVLAVYAAYWAGLPAAEIRLRLRDGDAAYHDEIEIRTKALPQLVTHFRTTASAEGRLAAGRPAEPSRYDAVYDLRQRRDRHVSMRFIPRGGTVIAERGPEDTSTKPPLAETFRSNTVDPVTAFERIRGVLRGPQHSSDSHFVIPVYDGARRFDIVGRILPKAEAREGARRLELTLRPIAGFNHRSFFPGSARPGFCYSIIDCRYRCATATHFRCRRRTCSS